MSEKQVQSKADMECLALYGKLYDDLSPLERRPYLVGVLKRAEAERKRKRQDRLNRLTERKAYRAKPQMDKRAG